MQLRPSSQVTGQLPSQVSPDSTTLLEQIGAQSLSFKLLQPGAQHPSLFVQVVMSKLVQWASQALAEPFKESMVQALESSQTVGQLLSQSSLASTTLLPQTAWQSLSAFESHPVGQQLSLLTQATTGLLRHRKSQVAALPVESSWVQELLSQQLEPQLPSQVSPASTKLLEQTAAQSLSLRLLQDDGQQPSPEVQAVISV